MQAKRGKKRSRNETIGSDSGIDHDKLDQSFSAAQKSDSKPVKKHKKSSCDDEDMSPNNKGMEKFVKS